MKVITYTDLKDIYEKLGNVPAILEINTGDEFAEEITIEIPATLKRIQKLMGCLNVED